MSKQTDFDHGWNLPQPDYASNDPPTYDQGEPSEQQPDGCMGQAVCKKCGKFLGYCSEVQNFSTYQPGEDNMIQREGKSQMGRNGKMRQNGLPFLTTKETTRSPQPAKIVAARVQPDNFKPGGQVVAIRLEFKGQHWLLNLRPNNPNLDLLCDAWGDDETRWSTKTMMISSEEDMFDGKVWMRLEPSASIAEPELPTKGRK